jgi:hypothetical protein
MVLAEPTLTLGDDLGLDEHEAANVRLMDACAVARRQGISRVIWAMSAGRDEDGGVDRAGVHVLRAMMVERLISLGHSAIARQPGSSHGALIRVEAPTADLSDRQMAELVIEMDLPVWTCWWWGASNDEPEAWNEQQRWTALLRELGWVGKPTEIRATETASAR